MNLVSLFTGAGGLDLGFKNAGFNTIWANEYDKAIWDTFSLNFSDVHLDKRSITAIDTSEIPPCVGIIGGPPCQSWSEAGALRGIEDARGKLFYEYIRILEAKQPLFFLAENVSGILMERHRPAFKNILKQFRAMGYNVSYELLNSHDYGVPQARKRVIIVGYHKSMGKSFEFPKPIGDKPNLRDAIGDMGEPEPSTEKNRANNPEDLEFLNHEYMTGGFSTIYMSRNRVRSWDEPSFTIQAGGRHAPIHPKAPKMLPVETDKKKFVPGKEDLYRRLSVRECARIQTFPDSFEFVYKGIGDGYKMIGNAVPVNMAFHIARAIAEDLVAKQLELNIPDMDSLKAVAI